MLLSSDKNAYSLKGKERLIKGVGGYFSGGWSGRKVNIIIDQPKVL